MLVESLLLAAAGGVGGLLLGLWSFDALVALLPSDLPSFNWTLSFRQQVFDAWSEEDRDVSAYDRANLMSAEYDETATTS